MASGGPERTCAHGSVRESECGAWQSACVFLPALKQMQVHRNFHEGDTSWESHDITPRVCEWKLVFVWEDSEGQQFNKAEHTPLNQTGLEFADYFPTRRSSLPWRKKEDHLMDLQKIFVFSVFFSPSQNSWTLPGLWFSPSVGLSTWDCFERPEAKSLYPRWPGLPYCLMSVPHCPLQLHVHTDMFIRELRISLLKKPGELDCFPHRKFSFEK